MREGGSALLIKAWQTGMEDGGSNVAGGPKLGNKVERRTVSEGMVALECGLYRFI